MPELPEEAVEALAEFEWEKHSDSIDAADNRGQKAERWNDGSLGDGEKDEVRAEVREQLAIAAPAIRKQERGRVLKALEEMMKRQELHSHDCGWAVPVTSIEAFSELLEGDGV